MSEHGKADVMVPCQACGGTAGKVVTFDYLYGSTSQFICPDCLGAQACALSRAEGKLHEVVAALVAILAVEQEPYDFPKDWHEQIAACDECARWATHPIQKGICDTHRRPLWDREKWEDREQKALIYRAKAIARAVLAKAEGRS